MPKATPAIKVKSKKTPTPPRKQYKSKASYDKPMYLVIGGVIGIFLTYVIISRALNTGSYWEYLFGLIILIISIRLFIRSIRLK
jgi:uncharacterized protein (DUF983 family)